jgi:hypothetical protein
MKTTFKSSAKITLLHNVLFHEHVADFWQSVAAHVSRCDPPLTATLLRMVRLLLCQIAVYSDIWSLQEQGQIQ